jgi:GNAT superfamily N-acetyltransferase
MPVENRLVTMVREHLENIPVFLLPPAYTLRPFQPGDEQLWLKIQSAADRYNSITLELFAREFGGDQDRLATRQLYLCDSDQGAIGTATAWFNKSYQGRPYGRVHWVAILPEHQGLGLAKPLMSVTLQRMSKLGHERAYLTTSSARIAAINLYLQFGFVTQPQSSDERIIWHRILEGNKEPTDHDTSETL